MTETTSRGVNIAFDEACAGIRDLFVQAARDDVLKRREVGARLCAIKGDPKLYGERAIERVAEELDIPARTLYRCAAVAETWSAASLHAVLASTNRHGTPLTWSHLVVLTRCTSAVSRRSLIEQCLAGTWSVRELASRVAESVGDATTDQTEGSPPTRAALAGGIQSAARAAAQLGAFIDAFALRSEDQGSSDVLLVRAIKTFEELDAKVQASLARLRAAQVPSSARVRFSVSAPLRDEDDDDGAAVEARRR